jgi:hypothetical protein
MPDIEFDLEKMLAKAMMDKVEQGPSSLRVLMDIPADDIALKRTAKEYATLKPAHADVPRVAAAGGDVTREAAAYQWIEDCL